MVKKYIEMSPEELSKMLHREKQQHVVIADPMLNAFMTMEEYERKWGLVETEDNDVNSEPTS